MCCIFTDFYWPADEKTFFLESNCLLLLYFSKLLFPPGETRRRIFIAPPQHQIGENIPSHTLSLLQQNLQHHFLLKMREKKKNLGFYFIFIAMETERIPPGFDSPSCIFNALSP